jgi:hypothetical protein
LGSVGVAGYAIVVYALLPLGATVHPSMQAVFRVQRPAILAHIYGSSVALLLGPMQLLPWLRERSPRWHRRAGRVYLLMGVGVGGLAGLWMAMSAFGGLVSQSGFAALGVLWLLSGWRALAAARARRFDEHRVWMIRNFALTFAAVTLRVQLGLCGAAGLAFASFYPVLAWSSWAPNLVAAELLAGRSPRVRASRAG